MSVLEVSLSDLNTHVGAEFDASPWYEIEQPRIDGFADATDDWQWIHVDPERAASGPFGRTVAHGYLTLSLIPRLLASSFRVLDQTRGTNYGLESVRFTWPVRSGDRVRFHPKLSEVSSRSDGGVLYKIDGRVEIEDVERPALVGRFLYLSYAERDPR